MWKPICETIILVWVISGFSAFSKEKNHEISGGTSNIPACFEVCGFNGHSLVVGAATTCYLLSASFDANQSNTETFMNGIKATSLGILTSYLLNFGGPILRTCYDYALESIDQKIFSPLDTRAKNRIEQFDSVLDNRITQANETSFGGFFNAIVNGNTQGKQE